MALSLSKKKYTKACRSIVGGVNSPVRAFTAVGTEPLVIEKAKGAYLYDVDSNRYIDYITSWGALILGHARSVITKSINKATVNGTSYGLSSEPEYELAELIKKAFPSIELLRLVNSGTEATMSTVRLARGYTGRNKIIKFEGCYHGHSDSLLVKAGSGVATFSVPGTAGVPASIAAETLIASYNDIETVRLLVKKYGKDIACIIVEPIAANMGVIPPKKGFLQELRNIADQIKAVLIFDEVISGFRVALGGAQKLYNIKPDLTMLGKIVGGGLPVGVFGGKREIMEYLTPLGPVYQAGTLSGNPVVASAGVAVLKYLIQNKPYSKLNKRTCELIAGFREVFQRANIDVQINQIGSMFTVFFSKDTVTDYVTASQSDTLKYAVFFKHMLKSGVLLPPSQFETAFLSIAHADHDIQKTLEAVEAFTR
ncbi:MAG: glutamate-1-semialdehyde 2,1-aminomutase [Phycisphaerae bacterium]|nr:glutamate-1-semialdehyde 2,1-aminomutase [Phycisphaerae bacterium]